MNDEQIKALLRELSDKAVYEGKSETVRISLDPKEQRRPSRRREEAVDEDDEFDGEPDAETVGTADDTVKTETRRRKKSEDREGSEALKNIGAGILSGLSGVLDKAKTASKRKPRERVFADVRAGEEPEAETEEPAEEKEDTLVLNWPSRGGASQKNQKAETAVDPSETDEKEEDPLTGLLRPERIPAKPPVEEPEEPQAKAGGKAAADEDDEDEADDEAFDEDDEDEFDPNEGDEDDEEDEDDEAQDKAPEFVPARRKKRQTPVEPADFESDAYLFRSKPEEEEEQAEVHMPAFLRKAGAAAGGLTAAIAGKAAAGRSAAKAKAEEKAKLKAEAKAEMEPKSEPKAKAEIKAEAKAEAEAKADVKAASHAEPEVQPKEDAKADAEVKADPVETAAAEQPTESAAKAEAEANAEAPEAGAETKPETEPKAEEEPEETDFLDEEDEEFGSAGKAGRSFAGFFEKLAHKGIAGRELFMIAGGLVLLILLIALITSSMAGKKKAKNVTAEDGLKILVEKEPSSWTKEADVELTIRSESPMQSITVNGVNAEFNGEKRTRIKVKADQPELKVMVVTQEKVLNADVLVPMIDSEAPSLDVSISGDTVTLAATDEGSGLAGIYYGELVGFFDTPVYTKYTEPFKADPTKQYCYYAVDAAGNMTMPEPTLMIPATSLRIASDTLSLFPGETGSLGLVTEPAGAMTSNLVITSSDEDVATVSKSGVITAIADGTTQITVSADGLETVACVVTVRSQAEITVTTLGDMTLGTDVNFSPQNSFDTVAGMYGLGYFMQNVKSVLEEDDLTFANFEGTLTTQGTRQDKIYAFRGDPSYTQILTDGSIDTVTLANNHSHDYGEVSLEDTKKYLTEAGIDYCIGTETVVKEVNGVKVGLIGIYTLDEQDEEAQLHQAMQDVQDKGAQVIIVAFHWGTETETAPDDMQKSIAHEAVDLGADLVVGHHPHVLQGIELYNGKYIAYSLGNFCFGGNTNPTTLDSMIFRQTFTIGAGGEVTDTKISIIPITVSSSMSWNNYQPTLAEGDRAESILNNVRQLSADLGTNLDL